MAKPAKSQILHVAVDKPTEKQLRWMAKNEDVPLSQILRKAITSYLAGTEKEPQEQAVA
jgi:hypothetical protein